MKDNFLELKNLTKTFGKGANTVAAVDHINLRVPEGKLVTLLGPSGCGKTTTLRMIAGFHTPTGGEVLIDGVDMSATPPNKRPTAMVFQNYALFPHMNVRQNISYGLEVQKLSKSEIDGRVTKMLEMMGLAGLENRQPRELSGGQQQRVSLARAMIMEPKVLLLDEPLSNLDAKLRVATRLEIRKLQQRVGITSVYVTHDQEEAMTISDFIVIMNKGKIAQMGSPAEIYSHPANRFVAGFIGRANFLPGKIAGIDEEEFSIDFNGRIIKAPRWNKNLRIGDEALLVVRLESVVIEDEGKGALKGTIINSVYFGSQMLYEIALEDGTVLSSEVADPQFCPQYPSGSRVSVSFKTKSMHVLPFEAKGEDE